MYFFEYFNYVLILFGSHCNPTNSFVRLVNNTLRCLVVIWLLFTSLIRVVRMMRKFHLDDVEVVINYAIIAYFPYQHITRLTSIQRLLRKMQRMLIKKDAPHFRRLSLCYIALVAALQSTWIVIQLIKLRQKVSKSKDMSWLHDDLTDMFKFSRPLELFLFVFLQTFYYITAFASEVMILIYLLLIQVIIRLQTRFLKVLALGICPFTATSLWLQLCDIKSEFEQLYSIYPMLKFTSMFVWTTTYVAGVYKGEIKSSTFTYIVWILSTSVTFYMLFVISKANTEFKKKFANIRRQAKLTKSTESSELADLIEDVNEDLALKLTAFGMFDLDKSLVLSFMSELISFSVLIIEWLKQ